MNINFFHYKSKQNIKGESPIFCRVTIDGERSQFSTGLFVKSKNWKQGRAYNYPEAQDINIVLDATKTRLFNIFTKEFKVENDISAQTITDIYRNKKTSPTTVYDLISHYKNYLDNKTDIVDKSRYSYTRRMTVLRKFIKEQKIKKVSYFDRRGSVLYAEWLLKQYSEHYAFKCAQLVSQVYRRAYLDGLINCNYPKDSEKIKVKTKRVERLDLSEVKKMERLKFKTLAEEKARLTFLFQIYTGMNHCDILNFNQGHSIEKGKVGKTYLFYDRQKTGSKATVPITNKLKQLLEQLEYEIPVTNQSGYNSTLKIIGARLGYKIKMSSKIGRVTCGDWFLNQGVSMQAVSKILGHNDIRITQSIYAKTNEFLIGKELEKAGIEAY